MAYSANRGNNGDNMPRSQEQITPEEAKKQKQKEASKDALKVAGKGAATYFGGAKAGQLADKVANSKVGDKVLNEGAEAINKMPGMAKTTEKLKDSGVTDLADKAVDAVDGNELSNNTIPEKKVETAIPTGEPQSSEKNNNSAAGGKTPASSSGINKPKEQTNNREEYQEEEQNEKQDEQSLSPEKIIVKYKRIITVVSILGPAILGAFLILFIIITLGGTTGDFEDALAASSVSGGDTGGYIYTVNDPKAKAFYDRIDKAKSSMESEGEELDVVKLVAVYHIINRKDGKYDYDYFTTSRLRSIAREITRDREETKNNLAQNVFPKYFPNNTAEENMSMAEDVFEYIDNYNSTIGHNPEDDEYYDSECTGGTGVCTYDIKGFNINGKIYSKKMTISNLQVRLMECGSPYGTGSDTKAIKQPMVPFEKYAAGVAYAEVGTGYHQNAQKAQMIAARSYALARPTAMNNQNGKKLAKENEQWILQISSCVADQVFCNIDQGCSYLGGGDGQGGIVVSGTGKGIRSNPPLPASSNLRKNANDVQGMLLVDKNGYVVSTGYTSTEQKKMSGLANAGLDYKQILLSMYPKAANIYKANCGNDSCTGSTGEFSKWLQMNSKWGSTQMGKSGQTLGKIGCLVTSVAMQIAKSKVPTGKINPFNPGTFVKAMNSVGGIEDDGDFIWEKTSQVVPKFQYVGQTSVSGQTKSQKLSSIKNLLSKGYYIVAEVKGNTGQHWVAIDGVSGDNVLMMDPASNSTQMWSQYNWSNTSTLGYFKAVA